MSESYIESIFNDARKKYPDIESKFPDVRKEYDVREEYLERTSKFRLLDNLLCYLAEMATLMHRGNTAFRFRNGATAECMVPRGNKAFRILNAKEWRSSNIIMSKDILTLRDKVVIVLNYFTTLMESEKQKLKQEDITTLTTLGESLHELAALIMFERDVFTIVERALEIIKSIFQSRNTFKLLRTLMKETYSQ